MNTASSQTPPAFSFKEKFIDAEFHSHLWNFLTKGGKFGTAFLILASLSVYQYGVYQLLHASRSFLASFIGFGGNVLGPDILRFVGEGNMKKAKRLYWEFTWYRVLGAVILWAATFFGASLFSFRFGPEFIDIIKLMSFLFLHDAMLESLKTPLKMDMRFFSLSSRTFFSRAIQILILLYFVFFGNLGIREVVLSDIISGFAATSLLIPSFIASYRPLRAVPFMREWLIFGIMKTYGKWGVMRTFVTRLSAGVQPWLIKILISTETVAIFSVAKTMVSMLKDFTPTSAHSILLPLSIADRDRFQRIYTAGVKYFFLFSILLVLGGIIFAPLVIQSFFEKYTPSLPLFYIMLFYLPISALGGNLLLFLTALRKQRFLFYRRVVGEAVSLTFYVVFIFLFGIWGLALEYIISPVVMFFVSYAYLKKYKPGIEYRWRSIFSFGEADTIFLRIFFQSVRSFLKKLLRI